MINSTNYLLQTKKNTQNLQCFLLRSCSATSRSTSINIWLFATKFFVMEKLKLFELWLNFVPNNPLKQFIQNNEKFIVSETVVVFLENFCWTGVTPVFYGVGRNPLGKNRFKTVNLENSDPTRLLNINRL